MFFKGDAYRLLKNHFCLILFRVCKIPSMITPRGLAAARLVRAGGASDIRAAIEAALVEQELNLEDVNFGHKNYVCPEEEEEEEEEEVVAPDTPSPA